MLDSFERIKCSNRAEAFEPHPLLLNKASFDSRPSCATDDTSSQQSSQMEEHARWPYRTAARSSAGKTWIHLDESCSQRYGDSPERSISNVTHQNDVVGRTFATTVKNGSERTVTTFEMQEEEEHSEEMETGWSHPSLIQQAASQLTSARAWLEKWEATKQSSLRRESCGVSSTSSSSSSYSSTTASCRASARRVPSRLVVESKVAQPIFIEEEEEDSECTCSILHSEPPRECLLQNRIPPVRCNDFVRSGPDAEDDDSWFSPRVTAVPQQDDDSLFQSVIQGANALPHNYDEYLEDNDNNDDPLESPLVRKSDSSLPSQQPYECRAPCSLYPWRSSQDRLLSEETLLETPHLPDTEWISKPSPLTRLQRIVSDPLRPSKPGPIHQRSRSDPVFSFHKDVLADETEGGPEEDGCFCEWNGNLARIPEGMSDVFTGSRFDEISSIGGDDVYQTTSHDGDDERFSMTRRDARCLSPFYSKRRRPVLSWFHQGSRTSSSHQTEYYSKEVSPRFIPRSSRRMVDEADWSLDVPRRLSKTECEI